MLTNLLGKTTHSLFLAYSYNFLPFILTALYFGTIWLYSPLKFLITLIISSSFTLLLDSFNIFPVLSNVSVSKPNLNSAIYSLSSHVK